MFCVNLIKLQSNDIVKPCGVQVTKVEQITVESLALFHLIQPKIGETIDCMSNSCLV